MKIFLADEVAEENSVQLEIDCGKYTHCAKGLFVVRLPIFEGRFLWELVTVNEKHEYFAKPVNKQGEGCEPQHFLKALGLGLGK